MSSTGPPVLTVTDVEAATAWWADHLGFAIDFAHRRSDAPTNYAVVVRDEVEVHLARRDEMSDRRRSEIVVTVLDLEALAAELVDRSVDVRSLPSGSLIVRDDDGNRIVFAQATMD